MFSTKLVLFGTRETGCFREMSVLYSWTLQRHVSLYHTRMVSNICIQHMRCALTQELVSGTWLFSMGKWVS